MEIEIKIPNVGESVQEAVLVEWYKKDGDAVEKDAPLFVVETDKVTLEIVAEATGILKILIFEGETVSIGTKVGTIDTEAVSAPEPEPTPPEEVEEMALPLPAVTEEPVSEVAEEAPVKPEPLDFRPILSPAVRRLVAERNIDITTVRGSGPGNRITKGDVILFLEQAPFAAPVPSPASPKIKDAAPVALVALSEPTPSKMEDVTRKPMSPIRRTIASRLLKAKHSTAMLTTFNEIDMSHTMAIRTQFKEAFKEKYGVSLGFMSFFIKASVEALREFPEINAFVDGNDVVYHNYYNVGIAIGTGKGLVVPVIRNADMLSFAELEQAIVDFVEKVKTNRLELADLEGGTFTITNGGVFGSLLSTPILNTPQSGILGMHKIEKRPVVVDDEINIRPMMYVALSYDHRIVDGREAVTFLVRIKECIENPERILMEI
jgi:2-oxoglutarate dehydrogenase E2 component (dihydrolipoamide succinyltransferase)